MSSIIENSYAEFHTSHEVPLTDIINENEIFGIISIKTKKTNIIITPTLFLFSIDTTSSMGEPAYKNITKLQVVKQTFRSMMKYLSKLETPVYVRVNSFNENVSVVIETTLISQENVNDIISKIDELYYDGSTNIGEALTCANDTMTQYSVENPEHQLVHIFMTDGQPTSGITNNDELVKIVDTKFTNNFVGFGFDHNALLLKKLSDLENSEYLFVDNMENTTLIYGEIIHRYLYSAIKNAEIVIKNGVIYNWKTNTWDTKLIEPVIVSELEKIYHIKTNDVTNIEMKLYGIKTDVSTCNNLELLDVIDIIPHLIQSKEPNNIQNNDIDKMKIIEEPLYNNLSKYMFRQRTQELLFKSKNDVYENYLEIQDFKNELKIFFKTMRNYMKKNDLLKDNFMITLCDDICIAYRSHGTDYGLMYTTSRSTSQGRQQTYNVTPFKKLHLQRSVANSSFQKSPMLTRSITGKVLPPFPEEIQDNWHCLEQDNDDVILSIPNRRCINLTQEFIEDVDKNSTYFDVPPRLTENLFANTNFDNSGINDDDIDDYELSNDNTSCYATEGTLHTMRSMSQM